MQISCVFGPVSSRRFGSSLGIDLSPRKKCCNFDCLYCELQAARVTNAIFEPPSVDEIASELEFTLSKHDNIDVITITANGEPTLYPDLKALIERANSLKTTQKTLILSNGTAVLDGEKFDALLGLDIVKFSLDSAVQRTFARIDRGNYKVEKIIEKMAEFSQKFRGELVLEILVLRGFNDTAAEFNALNRAIEKIKPARVDISSLDRPPAHDVQGVSDDELANLAAFITTAPALIARKKSLKTKQDYDIFELERLLKLRPQSKFDVENNFSEFSRVNLQKLLNQKIAVEVNLAGVAFFRI